MIHTFKFESKFKEGQTVLGQIPAGRILKSEPIFEGGKALWLIVVDDTPTNPTFTEHYWKS